MNSCLNCKWAEWAMTNHKPPRINKNKPGKCTAAFPESKIPLSIKASHFRSAIWASSPYEDCPTFQPKESSHDRE